MATLRLLNPDVARVEAAIEAAVLGANQDARSRTIAPPRGLAGQILGTSRGVHQVDGGGGPPGAYRPSRTSVLYAAWWTSKGRDKFVLIDGRRVDAMPSTPESDRGVPNLLKNPAEAIRGWRKPRTGGIESSFRDEFADLGRFPALDPVREALQVSALYGDASAEAALRDYDQEHPLGRSR